MARITIPRGSGVARVAGPAQATPTDIGRGVAAVGQVISTVGREFEKREKEQQRLENERLKTQYTIRLGKMYRGALGDADEDGAGLQEYTISQSQTILDEMTTEQSESDNPDLFVALEGIRRRYSLAAGEDEARLYGNAQITGFETRVNELANLARTGPATSYVEVLPSGERREVGIGLDDYVKMITGEIEALDVPESQKAGPRAAAMDAVTSSFVRGMIDLGDVPQLQNLLEDLKDDKFATKLKPRTQETLIGETQRALAQRSQLSTAAYKSGLDATIRSMEEYGDQIELPQQYEPEARAQVLTDSENTNYAEKLASARAAGNLRQHAKTLTNSQLDEYLRQMREAVEGIEDPVKAGYARAAYDSAEKAAKQIAQWRQSDPADYAMYASDDVNKLWRSYNLAREQGNPADAAQAFDAYATATLGIQSAYGGDVALLPKAEAVALRNTITDPNAPTSERWGAFQRAYEIAGPHGNRILRDVFHGQKELGQYMLAASLGMGDESRDAFAAVSGFKNNRESLGDVRLTEIQTEAATAAQTIVKTYNDVSGSLQADTVRFLTSVASSYIARGLTDSPTDAARLAYENTLGRNFYISGSLRVPAEMAVDPQRIDRRREFIETALGGLGEASAMPGDLHSGVPSVAYELFSDGMALPLDMGEDEKRDIFENATYEVRNSGTGEGVVFAMVTNGTRSILGFGDGKPFIIPWDVLERLDTVNESYFGPSRTARGMLSDILPTDGGPGRAQQRRRRRIESTKALKEALHDFGAFGKLEER